MTLEEIRDKLSECLEAAAEIVDDDQYPNEAVWLNALYIHQHIERAITAICRAIHSEGRG